MPDFGFFDFRSVKMPLRRDLEAGIAPGLEAFRSAAERAAGITKSSRVFSERGWIAWLLTLSLVGKFVLFALGAANPGFSFTNYETWSDYAYVYVPSAQALRDGFLPYASFYFAYPPLFLYALSAFVGLGGAWAPALPSVLADAATVVPVYLIARRFMSQRGAFLASAVFALAPLNLFYADYVWLNPPLTTLFLLVSLYLLLDGRYDLSAVALALSIGFKQTALIVAPVLLLAVWRKTSRKVALRYLSLLAAACVVFSIPYIFVAPGPYLFSIFRLPLDSLGGLPSNYYQLGVIPPASNISTINTAAFSGYTLTWANITGIASPVSLSLPVFVFLLPVSIGELYPTSNLLLTVLLVAGYIVLLYRVFRGGNMDDGTLLRSVAYSLLLFFALYPLYKYYLVGVTPLLALLVRRNRDLAAFVGFNVALIVIPRIVASYLPLLALIWLLRPNPEKNTKLKGGSPSQSSAAGAPQPMGTPKEAS